MYTYDTINILYVHRNRAGLCLGNLFLLEQLFYQNQFNQLRAAKKKKKDWQSGFGPLVTSMCSYQGL